MSVTQEESKQILQRLKDKGSISPPSGYYSIKEQYHEETFNRSNDFNYNPIQIQES